MSASDTKRWYVVYSRPQKESVAAHNLDRQGFSTFLPLTMKTKRHARKVEAVLVPLFPRYLFVALDLLRDRWRSVNGTYGVARMVMTEDRPVPVPDGLVAELSAATEASGRVRHPFGLAPGRDVRVEAGPFSDLVGQLETLDDGGRVGVLFEILGREVRVRMPVEALAPAS